MERLYAPVRMTVAAREAKDLAPPATTRTADFGRATSVQAGTFPFDGDDLVADWHTHDLHQLEYAFEGVVEVETDAGHHLLPPQQAIWIPAGLTHRTTLRRVRTVAVFFAPGMVPASPASPTCPGEPDRARVLPAAPVIREMIVYGARWPITRTASDATADAFFRALALIVVDLLDHEMPLCLPTSRDPVISEVMRYTTEHLASATAVEAGRAVGWSERTLRRRFAAGTGMTWRQYLLHSRLLRAMALLAEPGPTVLDVATRVGFESPSAFARSFRTVTGETPSAYRRRIG
jgi:AraC-like DNA-binding protein/quercetin dioxygenase-like cupin family protein